MAVDSSTASERGLDVVTLVRVPRELELRGLELAERAALVRIVDQPSYDEAADVLHGTVAVRRKIELHFAPLKESAYRTHKLLCESEAEMLAPRVRDERKVKGQLTEWDQAQMRIQQEAEARARAEAQRLLDEQIEAELVRAEAAGASAAECVAIIEQPRVAPEPVVPPTYERAAGISAPIYTYSAACFDIGLLCAEIVAGRQAEILVLPNQPALNGMARSLKEAFSVPGCNVVKTSNVRVRS
jgi:hypothetical protein